MDALTLGIGLQGQHNFSLDGAKALLDAQKAKAAQAIAAQKKADDEMSAAIKDATGLIDPSKYANAYRAPVSNALNTFIQDVYQMKKNGTSDFGLSFAKRYGEFRNQIGTYEVASKQYFDNRNNLHPEVIAIMDDPKGTQRMADVGPLFGQEVNVTDKNDVIMNPVPYVDTLSKYDELMSKQRPEMTVPAGAKPSRTSMVPGTNSVYQYFEATPSEAAKKELIAEGVRFLTDPSNQTNTMIGMFGPLTPDRFEAGPGGVGIMPKEEYRKQIEKYVTDDVNARFREEKQESGTKPAPREPSQSSFAKRVIINPARYNGENKNEIRVHFGKSSGGELPKANIPVDRKTMRLMTQDGKIEPMKASGSVEAVPEGLFYDKKSGKMQLAYVTKVDSDGTALKGFDDSKYLLADFNETNFAAFAGHMGADQEELMNTLLEKMREAEGSTAHQEFLDGLQKSFKSVSSPSAAPKKTGAAGL